MQHVPATEGWHECKEQIAELRAGQERAEERAAAGSPVHVCLDVCVSDDITLSQGLSKCMRLGAAGVGSHRTVAGALGAGNVGDVGELDESVANAIVAASGVLEHESGTRSSAAREERPVDIGLRLALDFEYAGEAGSGRRAWFERAVKLDLASAARIPAHHFIICGMSAGRYRCMACSISAVTCRAECLPNWPRVRVCESER